jgi:hypothetical protein
MLQWKFHRFYGVSQKRKCPERVPHKPCASIPVCPANQEKGRV